MSMNCRVPTREISCELTQIMYQNRLNSKIQEPHLCVCVTQTGDFKQRNKVNDCYYIGKQ